MTSSAYGIRPEENTTAAGEPGSRTADVETSVGVEKLLTEDCWHHIEAESFGRLAITGRDGAPDIFPLNYTVYDGAIYFRSAPGSKLAAIILHPVVALEIDGEESGFQWSVVVHGGLRRLDSDKEIHDSGVKFLASQSPTAKYNYVCIEPTAVSGRRFIDRSEGSTAPQTSATVKHPIGAQEPTRSVDDTVMRTSHQSRDAVRRLPITHFPPFG
ncbi:pyridoxamine 5'-phosphate oxidase family protein [Microbacterium sp. WCS2018Hpa-9]|uniref:pyridoxamine 5'-phosphate oxidase family protein n=1 Tax=Microbacterium sp. WCS2018Hpa-9 TaxID=3073635 RepID=UPI002889D8F4|nr:pyridoxamine 5'-phosphate oxidase family protein [Microbacterium sp. WCS2018Hpa-9]